MGNEICPGCHSELEWQQKNAEGKEQYQCRECASTFTRLVTCPDCQAQLEQIQACGSTSYFCPSCYELKSKIRVQSQFVAV